MDEAQYFFTKSVAEASQGQFPQLLWISFAFKLLLILSEYSNMSMQKKGVGQKSNFLIEIS
ncbi:hypothetical protein AST07_09250 [Staphylococcus saprophyticus]|nr:hypothetical protein SE00_02540 [Staphylococcus saprophyticus]OEK20996.1 hypothetical protein ASS82_06215 [Staphylococcus saprophyticus]OEK21589.1 hypothetical protein ASS80_07880 [Staphylococcus saprophyticus]OEK22950.1 hypothetical protein ASS81_02435 [Staphylococcus saprophyticus]OEK35705.1 hypothetical protein ASS86_10300 [Staphylococcus saprophyticus]